MNARRQCPNGHLLADDGSTGAGARSTACPVCGAVTQIEDDSDRESVDSDAAPALDQLPFVPKRSPSTTSRPPTSAKEQISIQRFSEHLTASGLILDDVASLMTELSDDQRTGKVVDLARKLVQHGQLTRYQADQLCESVPQPLRLGAYIITDRIGSGGMGDVFRAVHATMGRVVALKVLPPEVATRSSSVERFEREAAAAAQLQHDHIVTVYEVGQDKGRHFFAMRLVEGRSLAELLQQGPMDGHRAARYIEPVARAVAVAHQHGILHRDIKPHNILVDDETDRPLVADFGLARLTDDGGELTQSGMILGTPQYMPPEQARDATLTTVLSDVYSLGATLYHAMTGRPPFQSTGSMETLRQVLHEEPVWPHQLNSAVDRDLETICLKCLEKEPSARYQSATELADELARFTSGQPILARPISETARLWRWCRRNPLLASMMTLAGIGFLAAFLATAIGLVKVRSEYERAERGFSQARQVVHGFLTRVSDETLLNQPGMQSLKHDLLTKALTYYEGFLAERGDDPSIRAEVAGIQFRVGLIIEQIRSPREALKPLRTARRLQESLFEATPHSLERKAELASTWNAEARVLFHLEQPDDARVAYQAALELRQQLAEEQPGDVESHRVLANTHMNLGILLKAVGLKSGDGHQLLAARDEMTKAQDIRENISASGADELSVRRDLGIGHFNLGNLATLMNDNSGERRHFKAGRETFSGLLADLPGDLDNQFRLVVSTRILGDLETENVESADALYSDARQHAELLVMRNPDVHEYRQEYARVLLVHGELQCDLGREVNARRSLSMAIQEFTILNDPAASSHAASRGLGMACLTLGSLDHKANPVESRRQLLAAKTWLQRHLDQTPQDKDAAFALGEAESLLAELDQHDK